MVMESSGDEYEPFQVTEEDQLAERFPQRRRRRQTREDRIYGMWAQHDSDDEDRRWAEREGVCVERRQRYRYHINSFLYRNRATFLIEAHHTILDVCMR